MKRLDELFNKARNTPPPLTKKEAEEIVYSAPSGIIKAGKISTLKIALLAVTVITATVGAVVILNTGDDTNTLTESTIAEKQQTEVDNSASLQGKQGKIPEDNPAINNISDNNNPLSAIASADTPRLTKVLVKPLPTKKIETQPVPTSPVPTKTIPTEKAVINEVPTETVPTTPINTEPVPVISEEEAPVAIDSITSSNTAEKTDDSAITATTSTKTKKPVPPERFPQILVKTDLLGYFHNSYQNRRHTNYSGFDAWPYWGNRVTLGGELLFSRRLSWEITGTYGFPYGYSAGGSYEPGKPSYDLYKNYKGWIFSTGIKYFIIKGKNAGAGLYIGPYTSIGYLQERVLYFERNTWGENKAYTISVSKGRSIGYGAFAGYRLMYRNWFIEPQGGLIIDGKDRGYYNQAYFGQESWRYGNLWRIEFSAGYKF